RQLSHPPLARPRREQPRRGDRGIHATRPVASPIDRRAFWPHRSCRPGIHRLARVDGARPLLARRRHPASLHAATVACTVFHRARGPVHTEAVAPSTTATSPTTSTTPCAATSTSKLSRASPSPSPPSTHGTVSPSPRAPPA